MTTGDPAPPTLGVALDVGVALGMAKAVARRCARQLGLIAWDRHDCKQELLCRALDVWRRIDPGRNTAGAYLNRIIANASNSIVRSQYAKKRGARRTDPASHWRVGSLEALNHDVDTCGLRLDVQTIVSALPDDLRLLCHLLPEMPIAAVARLLNVPRTRILRDIGELQDRFAAAGLGRLA